MVVKKSRVRGAAQNLLFYPRPTAVYFKAERYLAILEARIFSFPVDDGVNDIEHNSVPSLQGPRVRRCLCYFIQRESQD